MNRTLFLVFTLLGFITSIAQEEIGKILINPFTNVDLGPEDNYSIVNKEQNEIVTLISNDTKIEVYVTDTLFDVKKKQFERPRNNGGLNKLIGHTIDTNGYSFIYSDNVRSALAVFSFNFTTGDSHKIKIELGYKKERIVEAFACINNNFYIFYANSKGELIIRALDISNESLVEKARFQVEDKEFAGETIRFKNHFLYSKATYLSFSDEIPTSIYYVQSPYKKYQENNSILFTVENKELGTSIYRVNMENFKFSQSFVAYPKAKVKKYVTNNSYVSGNYLFHISSDLRELSLSISSFDGNLVREHYVTKDDSINFTSTVMRQSGGGTLIPFQKKRSFDKTSKLLRKMSEGTVGIFVQKKGGNYEITFGGTRDNILRGLVNVIASPIGSAWMFGAHDKTIKVTGLFNQNFDPVDQSIEWNTFDQIQEYRKKYKKKFSSNLFDLNGKTIYSYIDRPSQAIKFIRF